MAWLIIIIFVFNTIQIIGGFGGTMIAMPFSILVIGREDARIVLNAISILCCIYPILNHKTNIVWKEVGKISAFMLLGVLAGFFYIDQFMTPVVLVFYSIFIVCVGIKNLFKKNRIILPSFFDYVVLMLAGIMHSSFISGGAILVLYAIKKFDDKDDFRVTLSVVWTIINLSILAMDVYSNVFTTYNIKLILIGLVPAILGIYFGDRIQCKFDEQHFKVFTNILIVLAGILLLIKSIGQLL